MLNCFSTPLTQLNVFIHLNELRESEYWIYVHEAETNMTPNECVCVNLFANMLIKRDNMLGMCSQLVKYPVLMDFIFSNTGVKSISFDV